MMQTREELEVRVAQLQAEFDSLPDGDAMRTNLEEQNCLLDQRALLLRTGEKFNARILQAG